jgi:hypothetical protein
VRQVEQQQPRVNQVVGRSGNRLVAGELRDPEAALPVSGPVQTRLDERAERGVGVDAGDRAVRTDPPGHQPHGLARAAAGIQARGARCRSDPVEQPLGGRLPDAGLGPQPFVLSRGSFERVLLIDDRGAAHC